MSQDGYQRDSESFNAFLAGVLLTRNCINNFEFFTLMNNFEEIYSVDIVSDESDICIPLYLDDVKIKLNNELNDVIVINGKKIFVRDYLYMFTTPKVREFFNISNVENIINKKTNNYINKTRQFVKTLCRSKKRVTI